MNRLLTECQHHGELPRVHQNFLNTLKTIYNQHPVAHILLLCAVIIGVGVRFWGLGLSSLSVDEYYLVKSIHFVLESGLPTFDAGGGYYTRGLIQQYITAGLLLLGGDLEWTSRLFPALANLAAVPAIYLIAMRFANPLTACIAASLFCLSVWEIEFARFARMYAPFQALFIWYIYFLLDAHLEGRIRSLMFAFCLSIIGLFTYEGAALLLVLNFLPLFGGHAKPIARYMLIPVLALLGYYFVGQMIYYDGPDKLTEELMQNENAGIEFGLLLPPTLLSYVLSSTAWLAILVVLAVLTTYSLILLAIRESRVTLWSLLFAVALLSALASQVGFSWIALATGLLLHSSPGNLYPLPRKNIILICCTLLLSGAFWLTFGLSNNNWVGELGNLDLDRYPSKMLQLAGILFNYPETITRFALPWIEPIPVTALLLFAAFAGCLVLALAKRDTIHDGVRVLMAVAVASILFISAIDTIQKVSRYSFFIFPIFLLTLSFFGNACSNLLTGKTQKTFAFMSFAILYAFLAEDIGPKHLLNINTPEIMYRTAYALKRQNHYYPRRDFESPGTFINANIRDGDIVVSEDSSIDLYLNKKMDYIYLPWEQNRFWQRAVLGATKDRWTGANLIYKSEDLFSLITNRTSGIWLVVYSKDWVGQPIARFREAFGSQLAYTNTDGSIDVFYLGNK